MTSDPFTSPLCSSKLSEVKYSLRSSSHTVIVIYVPSSVFISVMLKVYSPSSGAVKRYTGI